MIATPSAKRLAGLLLIMLAMASSVVPSHPAEAQETASPQVGVGSHQLDERSLHLLDDLGVTHVRTTLYWSLWERDANYRRTFERDLREAVRRGFQPLIVVHQQPSGGYRNRLEVYRDFADFMAARVAQFPEVRYWELWNEMDVAFTDVFGAGKEDVSLRERGRNYARMLDFAYPAIHAANPDAVVVTGGLASDPADGFLQGLYDGDARFDVLAIHSYGFPVAPSLRDRGRITRRIMDRRGDSRPLWNTEFGMEKAVVPSDWPRTQADVDRYHLESWSESIELNAEEAIYERVYGHVLTQDGETSYDLIRSDGSPRPAYLWLRDWLRMDSD